MVAGEIGSGSGYQSRKLGEDGSKTKWVVPLLKGVPIQTTPPGLALAGIGH